jgi:4,5-DOPA dioxygenase extradiol
MALPAIYLGHGAPPLLDDARWVRELAELAASLERPRFILVVSAHWEARPITLSSTRGASLVYDFWGFPEHYYRLTYPAPGSTELANLVEEHLGSVGLIVARDEARGLDHGAWVPLLAMYPEATIPVLQLSLPSLDPIELYAAGHALAPLREAGVLIIGSGFFTHNLHALAYAASPDGPVPSWSSEFDAWGAEVLAAGDFDALFDFEHRAPAARLAHPRTEHFAPLFVALGAGAEEPIATPIKGFWFGLSKRTITLGTTTSAPRDPPAKHQSAPARPFRGGVPGLDKDA